MDSLQPRKYIHLGLFQLEAQILGVNGYPGVWQHFLKVGERGMNVAPFGGSINALT